MVEDHVFVGYLYYLECLDTNEILLRLQEDPGGKRVAKYLASLSPTIRARSLHAIWGEREMMSFLRII
ncbi:MAG: hypothetical protein KDB23_29055, partial [Planctomycetales bacterium]|nr:hypothetical protein [Planctomycetales bacterium]